MVRLEGAEAAPAGADLLELTSSGALVFRGAAYTNFSEARAHLRQPPIRPIGLRVDRGADARLAREVEGWFEINLPRIKTLMAGSRNPTVIVAVNFRGQCFFENRQVDDNELKAALKRRLDEARRQSSDLTLTLMMDKDTPNDALLHLGELAGSVGFTNGIIAERK